MDNLPRFNTDEDIRAWLTEQVLALRTEYTEKLMRLHKEAEGYHDQLTEAQDDTDG